MTNEYYKNELIKELREARRLTQEELAKATNLTSVTVSRVETGESCSFPTLIKLATALDVRWWKLLRIDAEQEFSQAA